MAKDIKKQEYNIYNEIAKWPKGSSYTPDQIVEVLDTFAVTGSVKKTGEMLGIPDTTITYWKLHGPWWDSYIASFNDAKNEELDANQTEVIHLAYGELKDRIIDGDHVFVQGKMKRKPMSGKDLAVTSAVVYDKRQLGRAKPTRITDTGTDALAALAAKMLNLRDDRDQDMKTVIDVDKDDVQDV